MPLSLTNTPSGWTLSTPPDEGADGVIEVDTGAILNADSIPPLLRDLRAWADENNLQLHPAGWISVRWVEWLETQFWGRFTLINAAEVDNETVLGAFNCSCGTAHSIGSVFCGTCSQFLLCRHCRVAGANLYGDRCAHCAPVCRNDNCTNRVDVGDGNPRCVACEPRGRCSYCERVQPNTELEAFTQPEGQEDAGRLYSLCSVCRSAHICQRCSCFRRGSMQSVTVDGVAERMCSVCATTVYAEQRAAFERWDESELPVGGTLMLPDLPERPVRTISFELEFDGSRQHVASALYAAGLIQGPEINRYSEQGRSEGRYPCILKSDASVSGGELVTYLIDLSNENHAAAMLRMTEVMKGCRDTSTAEFSYRAGGHVHQDLHGMSFNDLWVLFTLFRHLELPLYYMAGAGAEYGHRSLSGSDYANPGQWGPFGDVAQFWARMRNTGRSGLHFDNYAYALSNCRCGQTGIGRPEDCTCDLGKATAEWRLWNAQITPRILHGWFALMQSIAAYATDFESFNEDDFPYLPWTERRFSRLNASEVDGLKQRLTWIFENLPLTSDERDSVLYVIKQSELNALGDEFLDSLLNVTPVITVAAPKKKATRNSARPQTFALEPVAVTVPAFDDFDDEDRYYDDDEDY